MKIKTICFNGWVVYHPDEIDLQIGKIFELKTLNPEIVLRDHHRSKVKKVNFLGKSYVVKSPDNKNKSVWIRFTTLYRDSEVYRDLKSQLLVASMNISTVKPVAALERRKSGMVFDSRIIYQYREGAEISVRHYPSMVSIMKKLHANGYLHDDPHARNFLQKNDALFVIDCKPRVNLFGKAGIAHNFITLARRSEDAQEIYRLIGESPSSSAVYWMVNGLINLQHVRRTIKNVFKSFLGIDYISRR